jgi:hypothetical protein
MPHCTPSGYATERKQYTINVFESYLVLKYFYKVASWYLLLMILSNTFEFVTFSYLILKVETITIHGSGSQP